MWIDTLPIDLVIIILNLILAGFHSRKDFRVDFIDGVASVLVSALLGYIVAWLIVSYTTMMKAGVVGVSAIVSYSGTGILLAISSLGTQVLSNPNALLKAALPPFLGKYVPDAPDKN